MNIDKVSYQLFMEQFYSDILNSETIPKKTKQIMKKLMKGAKKLDETTFLQVAEMHSYYLSKCIEMGAENPFLGMIASALGDDDENYNETYKPQPKRQLKALTDKDFNFTYISDVEFPPYLRDIKHVLDAPMEITFASNGTVWMNDTLWKYLVSLLIYEACGDRPILAPRPSEPESITLELGYNKDNIILSFSNGPSRCLKLKFNKHMDDNNKPYATIDNENICFRLGLETSFSLQGKYIVKPSNVYGLLIGEKIDSKDKEFI